MDWTIKSEAQQEDPLEALLIERFDPSLRQKVANFLAPFVGWLRHDSGIKSSLHVGTRNGYWNLGPRSKEVVMRLAQEALVAYETGVDPIDWDKKVEKYFREFEAARVKDEEEEKDAS